MKRFIFITTFLIPGFVIGQGITFTHDTTLAQVKNYASRSGKIIFVDCYTTWCGPCKWMAKNIFTNDTVGKFFNENFISAKFDMEKGDGKNMAGHYGVNMYPTFLFLDGEGNELHRFVGSMPAKDFIKNSKIAFDEKNRLAGLKTTYQSGNREPAFIRNYIASLWNSGQRADSEMDWYIATISDAEFNTRENFEFIWNNYLFLKEAGFKRVLRFKKEFIAATSQQKLDAMMLSWALDEYMNCIVKEKTINAQGEEESKEVFKEEIFNTLIERVNALQPDNKADIIGKLNYRKYQDKGDLKNILLHLKKDAGATAFDLNQAAWTAFENTNDKADLEIALELAKRSIALENKYYNNDTAASLAFKLKKKKEAKQLAEKAIALAKAEETDATATEELLKKINELK